MLDDTSKPLLLKNYINDAELLATWKDIEFCVNHPWQYNLLNIHSNLQQYMTVKQQHSYWYDKLVSDKQQVLDNLHNGHTLVVENYSVHSTATQEVCKRIESLMDVSCDMHVYCSLGASSSLPVHCDELSRFIIQIEGETQWKVFDNTSNLLYNKDMNNAIIDTVLRPGDMLYIPSGTYHAATPFEKRISISIPCALEHKPINRRQLKLNEK